MQQTTEYEIAVKEYETLSNEKKDSYLYSLAGYALYLSQSFEKLLMNIIWGNKVVNRKNETALELNAFFDDYEFGKYPMGKLIKDVKNCLNLSPEELNRLETVLKQRNYIVHNYFVINERLLTAPNGYKLIIKDFLNFIKSINEIEVKLEEYHFQYFEKVGFSKEKIQQLIDSEMQQWEKTPIDEYYQSMPL